MTLKDKQQEEITYKALKAISNSCVILLQIKIFTILTILSELVPAMSSLDLIQ